MWSKSQKLPNGKTVSLETGTAIGQRSAAITAYLNTLGFEDRVKVVQSVGFAKGIGVVPANGEAIALTQWLWSSLDELDGKPKGYYFNQYLIGNADGYNTGISTSLEWRSNRTCNFQRIRLSIQAWPMAIATATSPDQVTSILNLVAIAI